MEFTPSPSSIFQNKKIKYNNKKPTKNGIIWINFSKIRKARCTLTPLSLRSARLTQYMRFARCTSLSHILLRFTTQNIAYTETLFPYNSPLLFPSSTVFYTFFSRKGQNPSILLKKGVFGAFFGVFGGFLVVIF